MKRRAFTLLEVMIAVMIVTVVIAALLELQSNTTYLFGRLGEQRKADMMMSLLIGSRYSGVENDGLTMDRSVERFFISDELRQELKQIKAEIKVRSLKRYRQDGNGSVTLELLGSTLTTPFGSVDVLRSRLQ